MSIVMEDAQMEHQETSLHVGVDVGGTKIALGLVTGTGTILNQTSFPTNAEKGPDWIIEHLNDAIMTFVEQAGATMAMIRSIGIGVPGTVELSSGNVILAPNLFWRNVPLRDQMKQAFPEIPVHVEQDTNTAVLGEYFACNDPSVETLFFLTISTGIGSGLILDRKLYRGRLNMAGEIGHIVVEPDGVLCTCGKRGCLQAYTKGPAIAESVARRIEGGEKSCLAAQLIDGQLTAAQVARAASQGDALAAEVLLRAAEYIGCALANVVTLLNPDLIVIGGGVARSGALFFDRISAIVDANCYPPARGSYTLQLTTMWEKSAIIGAALLFKTFESA